MKKYIIIAGVPRAGKTTVSRMLSGKYGCQHIMMDTVVGGLEREFPETGIDSEADKDIIENTKYISGRLAKFIRAMTDSGEYNEIDSSVVFDICQLFPEDFVRYIDRDVCDIFYFINPDVNAEERLEILKAHDSERDYTLFCSEEENLKTCRNIVRLSRYMEEQCREYGLPYFNTSFDRKRIQEEFVNSLEKPEE